METLSGTADPSASHHPVTVDEESRPLNQRSCRKCNQRKTRCSRTSPCENCVKLGVECVFPPPGRAPRKKKRPLKAELVSQMKELEQKLDDLGKEHAGNSGASTSHERNVNSFDTHEPAQDFPTGVLDPAILDDPNCPRDIKANREGQLGQLLVERGTRRYVSHQGLISIENGEKTYNDESQSFVDYDSSSDEEISASEMGSISSDNGSAFIFGYHSIAHSLRDYYPSASISQMLWDVYERNAAPLIMVLYRPTVAELIKNVPNGTEYFDKGTEALVFAVYFASITSMKPHQINISLGEDHNTVIRRYRFASEQALAKADFLRTQSLTVLQAAVLYLHAVWKFTDTQFVCTMTVAIYRVAQGLGLHRDGSRLGLSPFETEMRRRIWWHIYLLDANSSEHLATIPLIHDETYDTKFPLNINDDNISPNSNDPVVEQTGFTETTFLLIQCEMTASSRQSIQKLKSKTGGCCESVEKYSQVLNELNSLIETRYLKFYDIQIPIQWAAATMARLSLARSWLVVHLCLLRSGSIGTELWHQRREVLFITAIEVVEFAHLLETNEHTEHWSWIFEKSQQWQAFAFILSELCVRPVSPVSDRAWTAVSVVYRQWKQRRSHSTWILRRPLSRLMKRVAAIRSGLQMSIDETQLSSDSLQPRNLNPADSLHVPAMWTSYDQEQPPPCATTIDLDTARESMDIYKSVVWDIGHDIHMG